MRSDARKITVQCAVPISCAAATLVVCEGVDGLVAWAASLLVAIAGAVVLAVLALRGRQDGDIAAGVEEFAGDKSFRFDGSDPDLTAVNSLFDEVCSCDEQSKVLIRNLSHEVRTPLTGLKVMAEGISDGVFEPSPDNMRAILDDVARIDDTLSVMRRYSDLIGAEPAVGASGDVAVAMSDACSRARRVAPSGVEVQAKSMPADGFTAKVKADPSSLASLFDIVIGNSFEHADGMTRLEVSIRNARDPRTGAEMVKVSIADDGCGMSMSEKEAKAAFSKADGARTLTGRREPSLGLGLSIADRIMEQAGGRMSITSKPGVGTCTTLWFPPAA